MNSSVKFCSHEKVIKRYTEQRPNIFSLHDGSCEITCENIYHGYKDEFRLKILVCIT